MDYGQPVNPDIQPEFFTSGAGTNQENINNFDAENNLDLNNNQADWTSPVERNNREIGGKALSAPELTPPQPEQSVGTPQTPEISLNPELGQAVSLEMPPGAEDPKEKTPAEIASQAISFDKAKIKAEENLNKEGVEQTETIINKFKDDNIGPAEFVNGIRDSEDGLAINMLNNTHGANSAWKKAA